MHASAADALKVPLEIENLSEWTAAARKAARKLAEAAEAMEEARRLLDNLPELKVTAGAAGSATGVNPATVDAG